MLYKGTNDLIAAHLDKLANEEIVPAFPTGTTGDAVQQSQEAETVLKALRKVWDDHTSSLSKLRDVLKYMVLNPRAQHVTHRSPHSTLIH